VLNGDEVRLRLAITALAPSSTGLTLDVLTPTSVALTPVDFPVLPTGGSVTESAELPGCPCAVQDISMAPNPTLAGTQQLHGTVTIEGIQVHGPAGWVSVGAGLATPARWSPNGVGGQPGTLQAAPRGLRWTFGGTGTDNAVLDYADRPSTLPAIAAVAVNGKRTGPFMATGLDGTGLPTDVVHTVAAVPGAPANGVVVDRNFAQLAAGGNVSEAIQQVWLPAGAAGRIVPNLKAEGVTIQSVQTESGLASALNRQGPGLAGLLFLAEAGAAAVLAAGGTILGLYLFARRRRYELAALEATGVKARTLLGAVAWEQLIVLAFGALVGIGTGMAAAVLVLRDVPEFVVQPVAPTLASFPAAPQLAAVLSAAVLATLAIATAASINLVRGVRLEQLREAPA
jgi:hypothetical protein